MTLAQKSLIITNWLFKRRRWLPLFFYPVAITAILLAPPFTIKHGLLYDILCLFISYTGLIIRAVTIGYTKDTTDTLSITGMYSVSRHPFYLGDFMMWLGIIIYAGVAWFIVGAIIIYIIYYEIIIIKEESLLEQKFGQPYTDWCEQTNIIIPNFKKWIKPQEKFSLINVIKCDHNRVFYMIAMFTSLSLIKTRVIDFTWVFSSPIWIYIGVGTLIFTIVTRLIFPVRK